ncbi:MAG: hypothetical protein NTY00_06270 [Deltaproteobacteria bacterium]|nr:hypothetical protein [Deltaproteobacteria bacterium]
MQSLTKAQKARLAIRTFKTLADALTLRGNYRLSGKSGEKLEESLKLFSPEIYGSMSDSRVMELQGLEYVIDRMPRGIEKCNRIILTGHEDFQNTSFEQVIPLKRRRLSYVVSEKEICFVITKGLTEVYDILTHITFLNIEAQKIQQQICDKEGGTCTEWHELGKAARGELALEGAVLDQAIWNLSIILGRTYKETRETYESMGKTHHDQRYNNGLFSIIYDMGQRVISEMKSPDEHLTIYFTPSLQEMIAHHQYASDWAQVVKEHLHQHGLHERPLHIISANMHSVKNVLYGAGALQKMGESVPAILYDVIPALKGKDEQVRTFAEKYGFSFLPDLSGSNIDVMVIDATEIVSDILHSDLKIDLDYIQKARPVIVVMDYAFGTQAFDVMDELLCPCHSEEKTITFDIESISIMGKAGILPGKRGDIMLATAHVMEGTSHNYIVANDLRAEDFAGKADVYVGPMVTVLGTSLQNRDVLERFYSSSWKAVGLEMEGGHYQRAINAAVIQGHISSQVRIRYAYYASDNPLRGGQTLASGSMGAEGIVPTYLITKVLVQKILNPPADRRGNS